MDFLTIFCQKSGRSTTLLTPPPSAHFYCYYRPPEGRSSPAWPWSTVRCGTSQHSNQFLVMGRVECGGWRVLSRARSLALNKWTAGATPI
jgi:hypothetical protein